MRVLEFRSLQNVYLWLGLLTGFVAGISYCNSTKHEHEWDYYQHQSHYSEIEEKVSPDGSKRAVIFAERDDGLDEMRHVKILAKTEKFDPNSISSTRIKFPWQGIPAFDFSILRPVRLRLVWTDKNNLEIIYPVDDIETITFQRSKSVTGQVLIHPTPAFGRTL